VALTISRVVEWRVIRWLEIRQQLEEAEVVGTGNLPIHPAAWDPPFVFFRALEVTVSLGAASSCPRVADPRRWEKSALPELLQPG
jgi:hypothetical protein